HVTWRVGGTSVRVEQRTRFPEEETTTLTVHTARRVRFGIHVRVPSWVSALPTVEVNGKPTGVPAPPGAFLNVEQDWRDGDVLSVRLPMALRYEAIAHETPGHVALMYGPLLLVALSNGPVELRGDTAI